MDVQATEGDLGTTLCVFLDRTKEHATEVGTDGNVDTVGVDSAGCQILISISSLCDGEAETAFDLELLKVNKSDHSSNMADQ